MPLVCTDILDESFDSIGLDCSAIPLILDNLESMSNAICDMRCSVEHVATTSDCTMLPADFFPDLFPSCDVIPNGAVVIQICSCAGGGVKLWVYDEDIADWVRLAKELAIGVTADFVDPNAPTALELLALFGGEIANEAMVIVRPTAEIWTTQNCGVTWQLLADVPPIGADVENITWNQTYNATPNATYFQWFDETLYTNGDSNGLTIEVGDLINITVVYGYVIDEFADATNPVDNLNFRFRLSGAVAQFDVNYGNPGASVSMGISNGLNYAEFNYKVRATIAGNLRLRIYSTATGTLPTGAQNWEWTLYVARTSVSVQRVDFN